MSQIYCGYEEDANYPSYRYDWSPSEKYPEYLGEVSPEYNSVYELVRRGFHDLGMDAEHYGTREWNPLGTIIKPNMRVLIKPNWVLHENKSSSHNMTCMVTNPSVLRVVLDYVLIALNDTGHIIVGDAPIQTCDFDVLQESMRYNRLWKYYQNRGTAIEVKDLRGLVVKNTVNGPRTLKDEMDGVFVDLAADSAFSDWDEAKIKRVRITNYAPSTMMEHQTVEKHEYIINPSILQADVIINLPKPKSHRKAGMTACAKNFIGACMRKECLPHHSIGAKADSGDEYLHRDRIKRFQARLYDLRNESDFSGKKHLVQYRIMCYASRLYQMAFDSRKDDFSEGSWYGNDTIWRTIVDVNRIVRFADKNGILCSQPQRSVFSICDMVVCGEKEGPMLPSPKKNGLIVMGQDVSVLDYFICRVFGFRTDAVKYIMPMLEEENVKNCEDQDVIFNGKCSTIKDFPYSEQWHIEPTAGWLGHIEDVGSKGQ